MWPFFYAKGLLLHKGLYGLALNSWAPLAFLEGLMKAEGRLWRGTVGAASLQRPPRSFQEGSENPSLRTTYLAAFCAKRGRVLEAVKWRRAAKKPRVCVCMYAFLAEKGYYSIVYIYRTYVHTQLHIEYNRRNWCFQFIFCKSVQLECYAKQIVFLNLKVKTFVKSS